MAKFCSDCGASQKQSAPAANQSRGICHDYPSPQELEIKLQGISFEILRIQLDIAAAILVSFFEAPEQSEYDTNELENLIEELQSIIQACHYHLQRAGHDSLPCDVLSVRPEDILAEARSDPDYEDDFSGNLDTADGLEKLIEFLNEISTLCEEATNALEQLD